MSDHPVYVVITAAGSGERLGMKLPKALVPIAGKPLLAHALERTVRIPGVKAIVVTAPAQAISEFTKVAHAALATSQIPVQILPGGATRQESVACGLEYLQKHYLQEAPTTGAVRTFDNAINANSGAIVLVHDAARAFTPPAVSQRVIAAVTAGHPAVVPGLPAVDTMRLVNAATGQAPEQNTRSDNQIETVVSELDRSQVRLVQTPQGFPAEILLRAHGLTPVSQAADQAGRDLGKTETKPRKIEESQDAATDDAALVARLGMPIVIVPGDPLALKITYPQDIAVVEQLVNARSVSA